MHVIKRLSLCFYTGNTLSVAGISLNGEDLVTIEIDSYPVMEPHTDAGIALTLPTAKAGGFLPQPLLHWFNRNGIATSYTVSTS